VDAKLVPGVDAKICSLFIFSFLLDEIFKLFNFSRFEYYGKTLSNQ
jgi:hypothetical protein